MGKIVNDLDLNSTNKLRISIYDYKGRSYIDVRIMYFAVNSNPQEWKCTTKGIRIPFKIVPNLIEDLKKALETIKSK